MTNAYIVYISVSWLSLYKSYEITSRIAPLKDMAADLSPQEGQFISVGVQNICEGNRKMNNMQQPQQRATLALPTATTTCNIEQPQQHAATLTLPTAATGVTTASRTALISSLIFSWLLHYTEFQEKASM